MKRYVQYGCGFTAPSGWINYDASPTLRYERLPLFGKLYTRNKQRFPENVLYGDIVKGLPEVRDSCDAVYCSHILEHLAYIDFKKALRNTFLILKPGGTFRGVVPDLKAAVDLYIKNYDESASPASDLMRDTMLGIEDRGNGLRSIMMNLYGNSKHLWMWDYPSLRYELQEAGFNNVRSARFGDAKDANFVHVEEQGRFYGATAFECQK